MEHIHKKFDYELADLRFKIRTLMHIVQLQFDVMQIAVDKCENIEQEHEYVECHQASENAYNESRKFIEVSEKLADLIAEFKIEVERRRI